MCLAGILSAKLIMSSKSYHDEEVLEELYHEKEMSQSEIADKFGVVPKTIRNWMDKYDIERRKANDEKPPCYCTTSEGYKMWQHRDDGKKQYVMVHRLLAIAEFGFDAVANKIVHHKNGYKFDNRAKNIEVMSKSEHITLHNQEDWAEVDI